MFKLVAVGGKIRGQEFILAEGKNTFGRSPESDHVLSEDGISKNHVSITVNGDTAYLEDLNSTNGVFVNGKLVKKITIKDSDKIALPNIIFELVYVKEKKVIVKKQVFKDADTDDENIDTEVAPTDFIPRIKFYFRKKVMKIFYSFNEQYEWNVMVPLLIGAFILTNILLTIGPVLLDAKRLLVIEISERGAQYAKEVARTNSAALGLGELARVNTTFLENDAQGVQSYELIDLEGRIIRPFSKQNAYSQDAFTIEAREFFKKNENKNETLTRLLGDDEIGISRPLLQINSIRGVEEIVGIIAIRFKPRTLKAEAAQSTGAYLESIISAALVGIIFFGIIYYLTTKPIVEMRDQIEDALRGKIKELDSKLLMKELNPMRSTINSMLQRIRELQNDESSEFQELEEDTTYVRSLYEFMEGAQGPVLILNSEKNIEHLNTEAEDLLGIRESSASGTSLLDSARDQGFAATVIDLCDQSANNDGTNQSQSYELMGKAYNIHITSLIGKDSFAKAFYVTFVLDE